MKLIVRSSRGEKIRKIHKKLWELLPLICDFYHILTFHFLNDISSETTEPNEMKLGMIALYGILDRFDVSYFWFYEKHGRRY